MLSVKTLTYLFLHFLLANSASLRKYLSFLTSFNCFVATKIEIKITENNWKILSLLLNFDSLTFSQKFILCRKFTRFQPKFDFRSHKMQETSRTFDVILTDTFQTVKKKLNSNPIFEVTKKTTLVNNFRRHTWLQILKH